MNTSSRGGHDDQGISFIPLPLLVISETISPRCSLSLAGISQVFHSSRSLCSSSRRPSLLVAHCPSLVSLRYFIHPAPSARHLGDHLSSYNDKRSKDNNTVADPTKIPGSYQPSTPEPTPEPELSPLESSLEQEPEPPRTPGAAPPS
ncbi:hypothetical protein PCANC_11313 [Puccinia coronata f. sp. avenae]|uniref:Uncharacterized protein n=1 Tax=Puccinia coronata f. sp. avenae TaxID=200324 RepID=A0A2N5V5B8_9BASI|nr:hypothetical protein PCANC_11313 [Puccinia coronata f. sp. avenae]